jgi:hypothetical protein
MIYGFLTGKQTGDNLVRSFLSCLPNHIFQSKRGLMQKDIPFIENLLNNQIAPFCFSGFLRGTKEIYQLAKKHNVDFYFLDHPYFFHSKYTTLWDKLGVKKLEKRKKWCRIVKNEFNCNTITNSDDTKYKELIKFSNNHDELIMNDWRKKGDHVLVLPPSKPFYDMIDKDAQKLLDDTITLLKQHTDREIIVRYKKPNGIINSKPIEKDLENCHAVVSFSTSAAVKAIIKGIPVFCNENSPTLPVSETDITKIEYPINPNRDKWLYNLVNHQFDIDELKSGKAYEFIK